MILAQIQLKGMRVIKFKDVCYKPFGRGIPAFILTSTVFCTSTWSACLGWNI